MKLLVIPSVISALALLNGIALYWHQGQSGMWLPRTDEGKWRYGVVDMWIKGEQRKAAESAGFGSFDQMSTNQQVRVQQEIDRKYPPEMRSKTKARNRFRSYVESVGMWQWPLSILAAISAAIFLVTIKERTMRTTGIALLMLDLALVVDATYRSYFGALGW